MSKQYHEPASELSPETRTLARIFASLKEEVEAIDWYTQRISLESDIDARHIMEYARDEEMRHAAIDLEFLNRKLPRWRAILQAILFTEGEITAKADDIPELEFTQEEQPIEQVDPEVLIAQFLEDS